MLSGLPRAMTQKWHLKRRVQQNVLGEEAPMLGGSHTDLLTACWL